MAPRKVYFKKIMRGRRAPAGVPRVEFVYRIVPEYLCSAKVIKGSEKLPLKD